MAKSILGDDPFGPQPATAAKNKKASKAPSSSKKAPKKTTPEKTTPEKTTPKKPPDTRPEPTSATEPRRRGTFLVDGAAARRASQATATQGSPPPQAQAAPPAGLGIDPDAATRLAAGSLVDELRHIEHRVTHASTDMSLAARTPSFLDRVGKMLEPDAYSRWLSGWMMRNRSDVVDDFGLDPVYAEKWRPLLEFLYHSYFRVEAVGMENLPDHGGALIVSNHSGTLPLDGAMIMYAVRFCHPAHRDIRPLVEDFVFHFPYLGVALNRIGCVRACQENAERLLQGDQVVAVFPEGIKGIGKRYSKRYQLQRFGRGGFIKLALKTRAAIVPSAVIGAEEIYPMITKVTWLAKYLGIPYIPITPTFPWLGPAGVIPIPTKWTIRFGEPIDLSGQYGNDAHQDRILVNRLTEQVRSTIQAMVDETLSARRSIIFG